MICCHSKRSLSAEGEKKVEAEDKLSAGAVLLFRDCGISFKLD